MAAMFARALQVAAWIARQIRALRDLRRIATDWVRSHAAACVASGWLAGMAVFGVATTRRVLAARAPDAAAPGHPAADGAVEQLAMLDVDEINGIRDRRLHALGLAAAGDRDAPDERTVQAARETLARGIELDGERVATAGKIVVVSRAGIAGWLKRNRGKKADPETLAWLRGQEAADGTASYAGWADREDGSILNWAKQRRRAGAAPAAPGAAAEQAAALREAGVPATAVLDDRRDAGSRNRQVATAHGAHRDPDTETAHPDVANDQRTAGPAGGQAAAVLDDRRDAGSASASAAGLDDDRDAGSGSGRGSDATRARSPAIHGLELTALGGAAARALAPQPPVDPSPDELASVRARIKPLTSTGAVAVSVRDHRVVVMLLCDRLFEHARPDLTEQGAQVVRDLGRVLAADRGHAYNVAIDPDRAFELVSNLAIAGLAPERIDIALKPIDRAIDVVELEWIP